eukprot:254945_1
MLENEESAMPNLFNILKDSEDNNNSRPISPAVISDANSTSKEVPIDIPPAPGVDLSYNNETQPQSPSPKIGFLVDDNGVPESCTIGRAIQRHMKEHPGRVFGVQDVLDVRPPLMFRKNANKPAQFITSSIKKLVKSTLRNQAGNFWDYLGCGEHPDCTRKGAMHNSLYRYRDLPPIKKERRGRNRIPASLIVTRGVSIVNDEFEPSYDSFSDYSETERPPPLGEDPGLSPTLSGIMSAASAASGDSAHKRNGSAHRTERVRKRRRRTKFPPPPNEVYTAQVVSNPHSLPDLDRVMPPPLDLGDVGLVEDPALRSWNVSPEEIASILLENHRLRMQNQELRQKLDDMDCRR